ncbi:MAG TPA: ATP-binding cassette domain-containing protein, partial [Bacteroidia bacterium]|nr:ATP-binding cassette domain-containing protein [Bacteroidia bacterium]
IPAIEIKAIPLVAGLVLSVRAISFFISKTFGDNQVLKNVSTIFEKGKTNLIIGQSGSGKTVMMKSCIGLINPDEGEILFDQRPFSRLAFL